MGKATGPEVKEMKRNELKEIVTLTPEDDPDEEPVLTFSRWRSELAKELLG